MGVRFAVIASQSQHTLNKFVANFQVNQQRTRIILISSFGVNQFEIRFDKLNCPEWPYYIYFGGEMRSLKLSLSKNIRMPRK